MKIIIRTVLLIIFAWANLYSQQTTFQDTLLERMVGDWTLRGTIAGQETTHDVSVSWILDHQYIQLKEVSREKNANGKPAYEALVFIGWDSSLSEYVCLWLDVTGGGGLNPKAFAYAKRDGDEIAFLFKLGSENFHTTFVYDRDKDSWRWIMDGEEKGKLQPFARVKLTRT